MPNKSPITSLIVPEEKKFARVPRTAMIGSLLSTHYVDGCDPAKRIRGRSENQSGFVTMKKPLIQDDAAREPLACQENPGEGTHQLRWKMTANVESPFFLHFSESLHKQAAICF